jgi:hypothetical protein
VRLETNILANQFVLQKTAERGTATFTGVSILHVADSYRLTAEAHLPTGMVSQEGRLFNIVP